MKGYSIQQQDIDLLEKEGMAEEDLLHSVQVAEKALEIAERTGVELDIEFVGRAALFHDLGKVVSHDIQHGLLGAERGAKLGLPDDIVLMMEKHIRGGLTVEEAAELGLPEKDYTLSRLEERIVSYADKVADIIHDGIVEIDHELEAENRFEEILRGTLKYGKNDITRDRYLKYHKEIQFLIADNS